MNRCCRQSILECIGGSVQGRGHDYGCCDACTGRVESSRLDILTSKVSKWKPRRVVSPNLEAKLMAAREEILDTHPSFRMVGINFLCPDSIIKTLCSEAQFANNTQDFTVQIRSEFRDKFFVLY